MKKVFVAAVAVLTLASCGTVQPDLYSWYNSEDATYQYTKRASEEKLNAAMAQYKKVLENKEYTDMLERNANNIRRNLLAREDPAYAFPAQVTVSL